MEGSSAETTTQHTRTKKTPDSYSNRCKICHKLFDNVTEVLKHELMNHVNSKVHNPKRMPGNLLKRKWDNVLKTIYSENEQKSRKALADAICDCVDETELDVIFKKYKMNEEDMVFIYSRIYTCLQEELEHFGDYAIEVYGSLACGLALKTSDIDIHIRSLSPHNRSNVYKTLTYMLSRSKCFSNVCPIRKTRVPIIKCIHTVTGFSLDINSSESYGVHNSKFLRAVNSCDTRIYQLMLFIKIWAKNLLINGAFNMTNYCLITLVVFYLQNSDPQVLDSIKILQRNAEKHIVDGINFGINTRSIPLDSTQSIHQLIKGFFEFYSRFEFDKYIIAPYLGKAIPRDAFIKKLFKYPEYEAQLNMFASERVEPDKFLVDQAACVQDMFCLNVNVAKCMNNANTLYFQKCAIAAHRKCMESNISRKDLYRCLLTDLVHEISSLIPSSSSIEATKTRVDSSSSNSDGLAFDLIPKMSETKLMSRFTKTSSELQKLWTKEYIDAILQIITEVFRIDITLLSPTQNTKCKKIDETEENTELEPSKWLISSYVDLWSGRLFEKNNKLTFMEYQLAQTEKLHVERRQDSNFAVQFKGYLTISVINNHKAIHLEVSSDKIIYKKDPLRKFFRVLRCILQNFNLKQRIYELEKKLQRENKGEE